MKESIHGTPNPENKRIVTLGSDEISNLSKLNSHRLSIPDASKDSKTNPEQFADPNQLSAKSFLKEKEKKVEEPKIPWGVGTCLDNLGKFIANIVENNKGQVIPNILVLSDGKEVPNIIIDKDGKLFDLKI